MSNRWSYGAALATLLTLLCAPVFADFNLNMTQGVTEVSHRVYNLHMIILGICTIIGILVYGAMIWAIVFHRKSTGHKAASFHESTTVEIIWTIIPFLILLGMAAPATYTLIFMENTDDAEISIKITGYQWRWRYEYVHEDVDFFSDLKTPDTQIDNFSPKGEHYLLEVNEELVVPVGKKIRFLITANDVLHSWWVPSLGFKKDAIPGFINEAWTKVDEPGIYRGQCAELCGTKHGFMPIVVKAVSEEEYQNWLAEKKQVVVGKTHNMMG